MSGTLNLTIYIPTYNRAEALLRLLKTIQEIEYNLVDEIIISDNCSNYNIVSFLESNLSSDFFSKCRIIINKINIGGQANINNSFILPKTKWMWLIGDDDIVTVDSLKIISKDITSNSDCAWFKYSTLNIGAHEEDKVINSLHGFIDYYSIKDRHKGNLVFMSNNIYNIELLAPYIEFAFVYSYTFISQILPPILGLDDQKIYIKYSKEAICEYTVPAKEQQWNCVKVFLGTSTVTDIPFKTLSLKEIYNLKKIFTFWSVYSFASWILKDNDIESKVRFLKKIYKEFFLPGISLKDRILYIFLYIQIKYHLNLYSLTVSIWKMLNNRYVC